MLYTARYESPLGTMEMAADDDGLAGLWFDGQERTPFAALASCSTPAHPALSAACRWLDRYFAGEGKSKDMTPPPLSLHGTPFQTKVWLLLRDIPYGATDTYGHLARRLYSASPLSPLRRPVASQAVGRAVGANPVSLILPCHRVIGSDGTLKGYAGGIERKAALLRLEQGEPINYAHQ